MSATMKFFSKVLDLKHTQAFLQYGLVPEKLETQSEVGIYKYINDYIRTNGDTPAPEELSVKFDEFVYLPSNASFDALMSDINDTYARTELVRLIQGKALDKDLYPKEDYLEKKINKESSQDIIKFLEDELTNLKTKVLLSDKIGLSMTEDTPWFKDKYKKRAKGESFNVWKSKFPSLNKLLGGGYAGGNVYAWFGRTGRGKSIYVLEEAIEAAMQGAIVLIWSLEMIAFEVFCRAYSSISARRGVTTAKIQGVDYEVGFPQIELLMAKLTTEFEAKLDAFLDKLNEIVPGKLILRSVDDETLNDRSMRGLEAEIIKTKADVVMIDPIYYCTMEKNNSKTPGGEVAATSLKLRSITGKYKVVTHVITQAEEVAVTEDDNGNREIRVPARNEVKKSKQILEDASLTIGIDTSDGRGILVPQKGRGGGEGVKIETIFLPNYGIVKEIPQPEEVEDVLSIF